MLTGCVVVGGCVVVLEVVVALEVVGVVWPVVQPAMASAPMNINTVADRLGA